MENAFSASEVFDVRSVFFYSVFIAVIDFFIIEQNNWRYIFFTFNGIIRAFEVPSSEDSQASWLYLSRYKFLHCFRQQSMMGFLFILWIIMRS